MNISINVRDFHTDTEWAYASHCFNYTLDWPDQCTTYFELGMFLGSLVNFQGLGDGAEPEVVNDRLYGCSWGDEVNKWWSCIEAYSVEYTGG